MTGRIGRYEIQSELGRGGFGRVFRAHDPIVNRPVAIKILLATGDPDLLVRFRNEAGATGKLRHRNIVVIYDFGEHEGAPYLVMELLEGQDLEHVISSPQPMSLVRKVDVIRQMTSGLNHAHSLGIVHRDVKPANIMLVGDGTVKIMDFGIALLSQATAARITPQGSLIGTFPYMAPEQFHGEASDSITDIFALGVTCYKFLTGIHPFHSEEMASVMFNIVNKTPAPIRSLVPECPEVLENVVARLLAKDRESRYQTLEDTLFDLEPIAVELRKERVQELVVSARDAVDRDDLPTAQALVREALEIDPGFKAARDLREQLQHSIKEKAIRPQVAALIEAGRQQLRCFNYDRAIQQFESALKLDKSNTEVKRLISEAQSAWEQRRRADRLASEAQHALAAGDLTAAKKNLAEAISAFPEHESARNLLQDVSQRLDRRERENRLREGLNSARRLMLVESFDAAIESLALLQTEFPDSEEVRSAIYNARSERDLRLRNQRLRSGMDSAKHLLKDQEFTKATDLLSGLVAEFPESEELANLAAYAAGELRAREEAAATLEITREINSLIGRGQLDEAIAKARAAITKYPGANTFRELLQAAEFSKTEKVRTEALERTIAEVTKLLERQAFAQAEDRILAFVAAYDDSPLLAPLRRTAEQGAEKLRRLSVLRNLMLEAQGLIDAGRPATATKILEQATRQFPGESEISRLLALAEDRAREQREAEQLSGIISEAESLARAKKFDDAMTVLDRGIAKHPEDNRLQRCREATQAAQKVFERERKTTEAAKEASRLAAQGNLEEALGIVEEATRTGVASQNLTRLKAEIEQQIASRNHRQALNDQIAQAESLIERGDPVSATRILSAVPRGYVDAEVTRLDTLARERIRQQEESAQIDRVWREIAALRGSKRLDEADKLARWAVEKYPNAADIRRERDLTRQIRMHAEALENLIAAASSLAGSGQLTAALEVLDGAPADLASEESVTELRTRLAREADIANLLRTAQDLHGTGDLEGTLRILVQGIARFPNELPLRELRDRIESNKAAIDREQTIARLLERTRQLRNAGQLEPALQAAKDGLVRFPQEARLTEVCKALEDQLERERHQRRIETVRAQAVQAVDEGNFAQAIALIEETPAGPQALSDLLAKARDLQRRKLHDDLLAEAFHLCEHSKFEQALAIVTRAIVQFGDSQRAAELRARLEQGMRMQRAQEEHGAAVSRLRRLEQQTKGSAFLTGSLTRARAEAEEIQSRNAADPEISSLAGQIRANIALALPRARKKMTIAVLALVVGVAIAGTAYVVERSLPKSAPVTVEVRTDPPGAAVQLGSKSCVTPSCTLDLAPGQYQLAATLSGYHAVQRTVRVRDSRERYVVDLTLDPLPPPPPPVTIAGTGTLVVRTGQPNALVFVDGMTRGRADAGGRFSLTVSADKHVVSVEKAGFQSAQEVIAVAKDQTQTVSFALTVVAAPQQPQPQNQPKPIPAVVTPSEKPLSPEQVAEQDWQASYSSRDPAQLRGFIAHHPGNTHIAEAEATIDDLDWSRISTSDASALATYAGEHPNGRHAAEARTRIADLAWTNLDKTNEQALKIYVQRYPDGTHAREAANTISALEAATAKPVMAEKQNGVDPKQRVGIDYALGQFNSAFQRKQPKDVKKVWPSVPSKYTDAMKVAGSDFVMELNPVEEGVTVAGDTASVLCDLLITTNVNGQPNETRKRVKVQLRKNGTVWLILNPLGS